MNINSLPTDNLYKFVALSGIALILFSVAYIKPMLMELDVEQTQLIAEIEYYSQLKDEGKNLEKILSHEKLLEWHIKTKVLEKKIEQVNELTIHARVSIWLGCFLMYIGFQLWYYRVQKPIDAAVKNKAKETT